MGREIRRVPPDWAHPIKKDYYPPQFRPLRDGNYKTRAEQWEKDKAAWDRGERPSYAGDDTKDMTYEEWDGKRPDPDDYMPDWPAEMCTHYQMYETCTEGTPISPVFATPEEVARYCADNGVSAFGNATATYEQWLHVAKVGWAPSMVMIGDRVMSGVEFSGMRKEQDTSDA